MFSTWKKQTAKKTYFFSRMSLIIGWPLRFVLGPLEASWPPSLGKPTSGYRTLWCPQLSQHITVKRLSPSPLSEVEAYDFSQISQSELKSGQCSHTALPRGHNTAKQAPRLLLKSVLTVLWLAERTSLEDGDREGEWEMWEKRYWFSILCEVCCPSVRVSCKFLCFSGASFK